MCITIPFAFVPCVANASAFLRASSAFVLSLSVDGAAPGVCSLLICLLYGVATLSFLSVHIVVYIYVSANLVAVCNRRSAKWSARKLMSMCHFRNLLTYMFLVLQVLHYSSLVGLLPPFILYCYTMYCGTGHSSSSVCLGVRLPGGKIRVHVEPLLFPGCGSCQSRRWVVGAWRESVLGPLGPGRALLRRHRPRRRQLRPLGSTSRYERALRALCSSAAGFC